MPHSQSLPQTAPPVPHWVPTPRRIAEMMRSAAATCEHHDLPGTGSDLRQLALAVEALEPEPCEFDAGDREEFFSEVGVFTPDEFDAILEEAWARS